MKSTNTPSLLLDNLPKAASDLRGDRISVAFCSHQPLCIDGFQGFIREQDDMKYVGGTTNPEIFDHLIAEHSPVVAVIHMNLKNTHELIRRMFSRSNTPQCLLMQDQISMPTAEMYFRRGVKGFLPPNVQMETCGDAIRSVAKGKPWLNAALQKHLSFSAWNAISSWDNLSDRERQVIYLLGEGCSTALIANILHLSIKTIDTFRDHIKKKLGISNISELALATAESKLLGLIPHPFACQNSACSTTLIADETLRDPLRVATDSE